MGVVALLLASLDRAAYLASLTLERSLSHAHSFVHASAAALSINIDGTAAACNRIAERAWWDSNKGSAVVVWAPGDQELCHALSLSLASVDSRAGPSRAGRPPYTVIVLVPESSDGLASLITAWAKRKADVSAERGEVEQTGYEGRLRALLNRLAHLLNIDAEADAHAVDPAKDGGKSPCRSPTSSASPERQARRRRLSIGGWSAPDVVGYGRDMLKGLQIGRPMETTGVGAIIPVVVDTQSQHGLTHAQSTIQAYCLSHDLLLRALVVIPSVMGGGGGAGQRENADAGKPPPTPALPFDGRLSSLADTLGTSLSGDVPGALNLLSALLPVLKADGGRVIGVIPSNLRFPSAADRRSDDLSYRVTRLATTDVWRHVQASLERDGVFTSLVRMASSDRLNADRRSRPSSGLSQYTRQSVRSAIRELCLILYGFPSHRPTAATQHSPAQPRSKAASDPRCPPLLLDAVRSALVRSWPRREYAVGLGPRLEQALGYVPGHRLVGDRIVRLLR